MTASRLPRVLLDVDGVLADFIGGILPMLNEMLGTDYQREHITQFDFCASLGLRPDVGAAVKRRIGAARGLAATLEVLPGAIEGVGRLSAIAEIYVVTSPWNSNETWVFEREQWLLKNFGIGHNRVVHASAKHLIVGDMLVDDKTSTLVSWQKHHPNGTPVLWATPHNRLDGWNGDEAYSWDYIVNLVEAMR